MSRAHLTLASLALAAVVAAPIAVGAQAPTPQALPHAQAARPRTQAPAAQGRRLPPTSIPGRMQRLGARIQQGAKSGRLTPAQQQRLTAALKSLRGRIQTARQNGAITPVERRQITRALNRLSLAIARAGRG
jgi:hypothetical protein